MQHAGKKKCFLVANDYLYQTDSNSYNESCL